VTGAHPCMVDFGSSRSRRDRFGTAVRIAVYGIPIASVMEQAGRVPWDPAQTEYGLGKAS
jgi:hypothetical protein